MKSLIKLNFGKISIAMSLKSKVLLTGATGFLGKEILKILNDSRDLEIITLSRKKASISIDLSEKAPAFNVGFSLVIHCAGKAHVAPSKISNQKDIFSVNVNGTLNLIRGLEVAPNLPERFVFISSVSVYGLTSGQLINEKNELIADDAYGRSKILAENILTNWCDSKNIKLTILRLPLIVGENPPGNLEKMIKAIKNNYYFNISSNPVYKSMVLAEDVANIILKSSMVGGIYNLTDGNNPSINDLAIKIAISLNRRIPLTLPPTIINILCFIGDYMFGIIPFSTNVYKKMKSSLTFDDSKARKYLDWSPKSTLENIQYLIK